MLIWPPPAAGAALAPGGGPLGDDTWVMAGKPRLANHGDMQPGARGAQPGAPHEPTEPTLVPPDRSCGCDCAAAHPRRCLPRQRAAPPGLRLIRFQPRAAKRAACERTRRRGRRGSPAAGDVLRAAACRLGARRWGVQAMITRCTGPAPENGSSLRCTRKKCRTPLFGLVLMRQVGRVTLPDPVATAAVAGRCGRRMNLLPMNTAFAAAEALSP